MEINRTHSHNSVLGINSIILEEDTTESCHPDETNKILADQSNFDSQVQFNDVDNSMSNVKCVAIIEDVEKMFDMSDSKIITRNVDNTSMESSNATSFSSMFNSIVPFSDMKKRYEGVDSTSSIDNVNTKSIFTSMNDLTSDPSPANKFFGKEQHSVDGDFYKDSKNETTLSSALLLDESQIKFIDEINKKKAPPPYEKVNAPRTNRFGAMPSCYIISKDDYFKSKNISFISSQDSRQCNIKKVPTSSQVNCDKMSGFSVTANTPNVPNSNMTNSNYPADLTNNSSFFISENNRTSGRMRKGAITSGTQLIRGNSMVSVVNKGSSSMLILKIQSFTKNYMDINPDFGWRRLIDDKNLPFSNFSNNSYMFYIESKKSTHIISLANLAINISCRAFILAVTHGYLDLDLTPEYLAKYLPVQISNSLSFKNQKSQTKTKDSSLSSNNIKTEANTPILNTNGNLPKHFYYKGGVDVLDEECGKGTMYLKSNFLGIYAMSSLVKNLRSENYRKRFELNKKNTQHKLESSTSSEVGSEKPDKRTVHFAPNTYYNTKKHGCGFYRYIPIPEYGWKLITKAPNDLRSDSKSEGLSKFFTKLFKKKPRFDTLYPGTLLCKVKPPHHYDNNCKVMVDAGSLAMNIAEQLYRLEISTSNREKFPKNTFGFSSNSDGRVMCPDGHVVEFVPEEVILNTASLLHEIYITQTYLIL